MAAVPVAQIPQAEKEELICTFACLALHDDGAEITQASMQQLITNAGCKVEPFWPMLFSKMVADTGMTELFKAAQGGGGGGGGGGVAAAAAGGDAGAGAAAGARGADASSAGGSASANPGSITTTPRKDPRPPPASTSTSPLKKPTKPFHEFMKSKKREKVTQFIAKNKPACNKATLVKQLKHAGLVPGLSNTAVNSIISQLATKQGKTWVLRKTAPQKRPRTDDSTRQEPKKPRPAPQGQ